MNFEVFYEEESLNEDSIIKTIPWYERRVWHRTKQTNRRNFVKIKSLPPEEQEKYRPKKFFKGYASDLTKNQDSETSPLPDAPLVLDLYYSADREGGFDNFEEDKLVVATNDPETSLEIEKQGKKVAIAKSVPFEAVKKVYNRETNTWTNLENDLNRFEEIKFAENSLFQVDFYTFKDEIDFELSDSPTETA